MKTSVSFCLSSGYGTSNIVVLQSIFGQGEFKDMFEVKVIESGWSVYKYILNIL